MTASTSSSKFTQGVYWLAALTLVWLCTPVALAADPGLPIPAATEASDQKTGSILFYNFYTSSASGGAAQNTRFSVTNTSTTTSAFLHLFFVASNGSVADLFICLTPNQTASFLASDIDPGIAGFMVAVAVDVFTGCPLGFNFLSGDSIVKLSSGHEATLGAEAFAAQFSGTLPGCDGNSTTALLVFDGSVTGYNRAPRMLAVDKLRSLADTNSVLLVLNRVGGNFLTFNSTLGTIAGVLYDDLANPFTFTFSSGTQQSAILSDSFPLTSPVFSSVIPAGRTGWMKLYTVNDVGILGAVLNFNPNAAASGAAFTGGHNLRKLTLSTSNVITMPVFAPSC